MTTTFRPRLHLRTGASPPVGRPTGPAQLGLPSSTALVVGSIIGTGVFTMPAVLAGAVLAAQLDADVLALLTDVPNVVEGWATAAARPIGATTPSTLRRRTFAPGSMGPKVEAVCRFVESGGPAARTRMGAIGALADLPEIVAGRAGTRVTSD
jgi:carbamate kinase